MRVCFAISSNAHRNSRAVRQIRALAESNVSVSVFHHGKTDHDNLNSRKITLHTVAPPSTSSGPRYFLQLHQNLKSALEAAKPECDFYHASDLYALPAVARRARANRVPYTFDSRELYTHVVGTNNRPWATWAWYTIQKRLLPRAYAVFTVSNSIAEYLSAKYQIPRPTVIPNVPDARVAVPPPISSGNPSAVTDTATRSRSDIRTAIELPKSSFLAVYAGSVRANRGCMTAVRAVALAPAIHLAFLGNGPLERELADTARRLNCADRIHFVDPVEPGQVSHFLSTADVGLSLLPDNCLNHRFALPNKLFEYIAGGVPVVASNLPEMSRLISDHALGSCVEPSDAGALARELTRLASDHGQLELWKTHCRQAADLLSWESYKPLFVNTFLDLQQT